MPASTKTLPSLSFVSNWMPLVGETLVSSSPGGAALPSRCSSPTRCPPVGRPSFISISMPAIGESLSLPSFIPLSMPGIKEPFHFFRIYFNATQYENPSTRASSKSIPPGGDNLQALCLPAMLVDDLSRILSNFSLDTEYLDINDQTPCLPSSASSSPFLNDKDNLSICIDPQLVDTLLQ